MKEHSIKHRVLSIIGIVLCVILIPILIINCILLIKGWTNQDEVPTIGNVAPLIVLTDSMKGTEPDSFPGGGSLIFVKTATAEEIKVGDVIAFFDPASKGGDAVVTHRVVKIIEQDGKIYFTTKGDYNLIEDQVAVPAEKLVGKYTGTHIPALGSVAMFMSTPWGLVVCVLLPILLLVGWDYLRRARYNKKHEEDKDALLAELEELRRLKSEQGAAEAVAEEPAEEPTVEETAEVPAE